MGPVSLPDAASIGDMIRGIDHLVVAVADPEAAAAELASRVGLACTGGGEHPGAGTSNRVAFLADGSYLELIGVDDPAAARANPVGAASLRALEAVGEGLATFALRDDDLEATLRTRPELGTRTHGSRQRPDGEVVEWWTAAPTERLSPTVPFLIEHSYAGAEWGPDAMRARAEQVHPIGSPVRLVRLDLAVDDPPLAAGELASTLGVPVQAVPDLAVVEVGAHVVRFLARRNMAVAAAVVLSAEVGTPVSVDLFGLRFLVEPSTALPARTVVTRAGGSAR
jgi:hypothetical protein